MISAKEAHNAIVALQQIHNALVSELGMELKAAAQTIEVLRAEIVQWKKNVSDLQTDLREKIAAQEVPK